MSEDGRTKIDDLFRRYAAGVSRYLLLRLQNPELAEEITARVFLTVVRHIEQQKGSAVGWLWAIVRSELSRHYREPRLAAWPSDVIALSPEPADALDREEQNRLMREAVLKLPDDDQQLLSLKFFLGASNLEIAATLGLTPSNVGVKVHRALKELRKRLEPQFS